MQVTQVRSLVQEDLTCQGATKPTCHNDWSLHALGPLSHKYWAHVLQSLKPTRASALQPEKRPQWEVHAPQWDCSPEYPQPEKACSQEWRLSTTKNKEINRRNTSTIHDIVNQLYFNKIIIVIKEIMKKIEEHFSTIYSQYSFGFPLS